MRSAGKRRGVARLGSGVVIALAGVAAAVTASGTLTASRHDEEQDRSATLGPLDVPVGFVGKIRPVGCYQCQSRLPDSCWSRRVRLQVLA